MKYLGLHLDDKWCFEEHFAYLAPRVNAVAASLGRLLPNISGPDGRVRRVYAGIVHAVAFYGAPVWAGEMMANQRIKALMRASQRKMAIRVARGYCMISHAAATVLSGMSPIELLAQMYGKVYRHTRALKERGKIITDRTRRGTMPDGCCWLDGNANC